MPKEHGTMAGYFRHRRASEASCAECKAGYAAYAAGRRGPTEKALCAGGCGKLVRKSAYDKPAKCRACNACEFTARQRATRAKLRKAARGKRAPKNWAWCSGTCQNCGDWFARKGNPSPYCSKRCSKRGRHNYMTDAGRLAIYARDGWLCQLCAEPVDLALHHLDDWAATLDHIVPQSRGGSHDPSNLRLAHRWCNSVRGDESFYGAEFFAA